MKALNLITCITFGMLSVASAIVAIVQVRMDLLALTFMSGVIAGVSYHDYKHPDKITDKK